MFWAERCRALSIIAQLTKRHWRKRWNTKQETRNMCEKSRLTHSILAKFIALQDIETATFAYHGQIAKAKAAAELASVCHDALIKYSQAICKVEADQRNNEQQPWVPDDVFDLVTH